MTARRLLIGPLCAAFAQRAASCPETRPQQIGPRPEQRVAKRERTRNGKKEKEFASESRGNEVAIAKLVVMVRV